MSTKSQPSKVPSRRLRTAEDILQNNEEILTGLVDGTISPKVAEQRQQCNKATMGLSRMFMQYWKMSASAGRKAPVPRDGLLRSLVGLPEKVTPQDGEVIRGMIAEN